MQSNGIFLPKKDDFRQNKSYFIQINERADDPHGRR